MQELLQTSRSGVPGWMDPIIAQLEKIAKHFAEEMTRYLQKLDALSQRVEEAIRRVDVSGTIMPDPLTSIVPWAMDALRYLDHRKEVSTNELCPFPELFQAVKTKNPNLLLGQFHDGIRRLADHRAFYLIPAESMNQLPQPEYAMLDGTNIWYYVRR
jgi:hypothetical protein